MQMASCAGIWDRIKTENKRDESPFLFFGKSSSNFVGKLDDDLIPKLDDYRLISELDDDFPQRIRRRQAMKPQRRGQIIYYLYVS